MLDGRAFTAQLFSMNVLLLIAFVVLADACLRMRVPTPGIPACGSTCTPEMIKIVTEGDAQEFEDAKSETTDNCLRRKFTCKGSEAKITATGPGKVESIEDKGAGIVTYTVTCNTAGTGWEKNGAPVTSMECSHVPYCQACGDESSLPENTGPHMVDASVELENGCSVGYLFCGGSTNAAIKVFKDNSGVPFATIVPTSDDTKTATLKLVCNADDSWSYNGEIVTSIDCSTT